MTILERRVDGVGCDAVPLKIIPQLLAPPLVVPPQLPVLDVEDLPDLDVVLQSVAIAEGGASRFVVDTSRQQVLYLVVRMAQQLFRQPPRPRNGPRNFNSENSQTSASRCLVTLPTALDGSRVLASGFVLDSSGVGQCVGAHQGQNNFLLITGSPGVCIRHFLSLSESPAWKRQGWGGNQLDARAVKMAYRWSTSRTNAEVWVSPLRHRMFVPPGMH